MRSPGNLFRISLTFLTASASLKDAPPNLKTFMPVILMIPPDVFYRPSLSGTHAFMVIFLLKQI
jgi:hypothetical protein